MTETVPPRSMSVRMAKAVQDRLPDHRVVVEGSGDRHYDDDIAVFRGRKRLPFKMQINTRRAAVSHPGGGVGGCNRTTGYVPLKGDGFTTMANVLVQTVQQGQMPESSVWLACDIARQTPTN